MSVNPIVVTAGGGSSSSGFVVPDLDPVWGGDFGSAAPSVMDGKNIGAIKYTFASSNNSSISVDVQYSGAPPADNYITSVTFTGDTGAYVLDQASGLSTNLDAGTSNTWKRWQWNRFATAFPSQANPFSISSNYTVTITTNPAAVTATIPNVVGQTRAAGTATLVATGFQVTTIQASSNVVAGGIISEHNPAGGTFPLGGNVTITVSTGPAQVAGMGGDVWGSAGGSINPTTSLPVIGQTLAYAQQPENAIVQGSQSVMSAMSSAQLSIIQSTPATSVPTTPKVGA